MGKRQGGWGKAFGIVVTGKKSGKTGRHRAKAHRRKEFGLPKQAGRFGVKLRPVKPAFARARVGFQNLFHKRSIYK